MEKVIIFLLVALCTEPNLTHKALWYIFNTKIPKYFNLSR
jgi:hypothetical protein